MEHSTITRRGLVAGLAGVLVSGTLLVTGAGGSLAHELDPGQRPQVRTGARPTPTGSGPSPADSFIARLPASIRYGWTATSPGTHKGDHYSLVLTNGPTAQQLGVRVMIMDHINQQNTAVIERVIQLAANERRELTADNNYGTANHFHTGLGTENGDLTLEVKITDSSGAETARFNQRAFLQRDRGQTHGN